MRISVRTIFPSFMHRRRSRQRVDEVQEQRWTYDLVALHVQLLMAMASVDGRVVRSELEAVDRVVERAPLPADQRRALQDLVLRLVSRTPPLEDLLEPLTVFRDEPTLARALVTDLVRVAAVDLVADPREQALLQRVCDFLGVDPITIPAQRPETVERPVNRAPSGIDRVSAERMRDAVRRSLEASYARDSG
ncbi:MAG: Tellurite resistance protein TerB [Thermoleophilia bacterium]|nr:Tellurite resistance protein TerB [Thermoleophilia bacterium]